MSSNAEADGAPIDFSTAPTVYTHYTPRWFQQEIHTKLRRFSVLVMHRRAGKTILAVNQLIKSALKTQKTEARFAYVAPYLKQAKQIVWDYLKRYTRAIPSVLYNEAELSVTLPNGSRIRLYGADNPDSMRGLYFDGVVLDEVADMRPETWGEVVRPALTDRKGWCLFIGTPKGMNLFYELYQLALSDPKWFAGCYRADETGAIDAEELELARTSMSPNQYRQEFLCDFSASTDDTLITIDDVTTACARKVRECDLIGLPRVLGVDVARFGDDRSVIARRWGYGVLEPIIMQGLDNMQLVGRIAALIAEWSPDAVFIDAGRGEGVIDRLRQLGHAVIEVNFGGKPNDPIYVNKKTEMWVDMQKAIRLSLALPNHSDLKTDLCVPKYAFDAANRMKLESKDDIKRRGMRSPDVADALALTFAAHVAPKGIQLKNNFLTNQRKPFIMKDYDPFNSE